MHQLRQNGDLRVAFHHNLMRTLLITSCKDPLPWSLYSASAYQQGDTHVELTFYTFFLVSTAFQDILNFVVILYRWKLTDSYNPPNKSEEVIFFLWSQSCTLSFNSDLSVLSEILKKCLLCPLLKKKNDAKNITIKLLTIVFEMTLHCIRQEALTVCITFSGTQRQDQESDSLIYSLYLYILYSPLSWYQLISFVLETKYIWQIDTTLRNLLSEKNGIKL